MLKRTSFLHPSANRSDGLSGSYSRTAPEINLIPFIDVLLVVLIFLMVSTTFTKYQELSITLPSAEGASSANIPKEITVAVSNEGRYAINGVLVDQRSLNTKLTQLSNQWSKEDGTKDGRVVISADGRAPHQSVMRVLEAARESGLANVVFATQSKSKTK
jgi:biopolymer transport protein ExbD